MNMWLVCLVFCTFPCLVLASCTDNQDPIYNLAVNQGDYPKAFHVIVQELRLGPEEANHFKIVPGFSVTHDDRNGQADPESLDIHLDTQLFVEGKEGACQGIAHELTHLRQFRRDRKILHNYFSSHAATEGSWTGCDHEELNHPDSTQVENQAYSCLQDNDLVPHAASMDIEAVMAQIPFATGGVLREEDINYLIENLNRWSDHQTMITDHSNEGFYLPEIKRKDIQLFCSGVKSARTQRDDLSLINAAWRYFCRRRV